MVRSFLRHTRVQSLDELKARILKGIGEINAALQRNAAVARQSLAQSEGLRGMDADKLVGEPLLFGRGVLLLMLIESVADGYVARLNLTDASAAWTFRARGGIHSLALNGNGSLVAAGKIGEVVIPHLSRPELAGPFQTLSQPIPPCSDIAEPNILAAQG